MISRVVSSTAVASATFARFDVFGEVPSLNARMLAAASSAVSVEPSVNVTSSRRVMVRTVLSSFHSHSVARFGSISPSGSALSRLS